MECEHSEDIVTLNSVVRVAEGSDSPLEGEAGYLHKTEMSGCQSLMPARSNRDAFYTEGEERILYTAPLVARANGLAACQVSALVL